MLLVLEKAPPSAIWEKVSCQWTWETLRGGGGRIKVKGTEAIGGERGTVANKKGGRGNPGSLTKKKGTERVTGGMARSSLLGSLSRNWSKEQKVRKIGTGWDP